jgi:hypothetical protein
VRPEGIGETRQAVEHDPDPGEDDRAAPERGDLPGIPDAERDEQGGCARGRVLDTGPNIAAVAGRAARARGCAKMM